MLHLPSPMPLTAPGRCGQGNYLNGGPYTHHLCTLYTIQSYSINSKHGFHWHIHGASLAIQMTYPWNPWAFHISATAPDVDVQHIFGSLAFLRRGRDLLAIFGGLAFSRS
jgi:hypothetical protein